MVRGDHRFSDRDMIFGRFTFTRGPTTPYEGNLPTIGQRIQRRDSRSASFSYNHTFRSNLLNEFRWGMVLNNNPLQGPVRGLDQVKELGLQNLAPNLPDIGGMFKVTWSGIGLEPLSQIDYANPGYRNHGEEFQENLSWFRGRHNLKFGLNFTRAEIDEYYAPSALFGSASFSSRYTSSGLAGQGHPYADFLLGIPSEHIARLRARQNRPQPLADRLLRPGRFQDQFPPHPQFRRALRTALPLARKQQPRLGLRPLDRQHRRARRSAFARQSDLPQGLCPHHRG